MYTRSVLGTAPLNFGTRAANLRHSTPELCRVNAYPWARVPKHSGGPSTPEIGSLGPPVWSAVPEFEWVLDRFLVILLEGLELISIEHVLHKMASEKNGVFVVARYKLGSRSNGNSSRSVREGGGGGQFL